MAWIRRLADAPKSNPSQKVEEWEPQRTKEASTLGLKTMQKWWSNGVECVSANKYFVGPTVISKPDKTQDGRAFLVWKAKFYLARRCTSMGPHVVEVVLVFRGSSCSRESHDRCIKPGQPAAWKASKKKQGHGDEEGRRRLKSSDAKGKRNQAKKRLSSLHFHSKLDPDCFVSILQ